jgi:hypothetical protein
VIGASWWIGGCGGADANDDRSARDERPPTRGELRVEYLDELPGDEEGIARTVRSTGIADDVARAVNASVRLPHDVTIVMGADARGPSWAPDERVIALPWAFASSVRAPLQRAGYDGDRLERGIERVIAFALTHEVAHMLIDELELPVVGNEEDAADSFSTMIAVSLLDDGPLVEAAADYFAASDAGARRASSEYHQVHNLNIQRYLNASCLVYGSDPVRYGAFAVRSELAQSRRAQCPAEWQRTSRSWLQLLTPHLRTPGR